MNTNENKITKEEVARMETLIADLKLDHPEYSDQDAKDHALRLLAYKLNELQFEDKPIDTMHESDNLEETKWIQQFAKAVQKLRARGDWRVENLVDEIYYQYDKSPLDIPNLVRNISHVTHYYDEETGAPIGESEKKLL